MAIYRYYNLTRHLSTSIKKIETDTAKFENVFSFPFVKNFALLNRLKVFHFYGTCIALPTSGLLEILNIFPESTFLTASYIGATGGAVLSLFTLPFKDIIGHLYISSDNKLIKISSVDYYGKRRDRIVTADEWIPLHDMKPRSLDAIYLQPELTDGSKYKLLVKFGKVKNSKKIGEVLE